MKWIRVIVLFGVLLCGCSGVNYESVSDVYAPQSIPVAADLLVFVPPDATVMTSEDGAEGSFWLCDNYTLAVQTLDAGNLDETLRTVTGYGRDQLTVMELQQGNCKRYECAWVSAGEGGDQVARTVVLDDGNYHYCMSLQTDAKLAGQMSETWQKIASSVSLDIAP